MHFKNYFTAVPKLVLRHNQFRPMIIKLLTQLAELIEDALLSMANLSKSSGRMNFTQMARCGRSCESRFRQNFKKSFDWITFNRHFLDSASKHRIAIAIDPCFVPKAGKKTPGLEFLGLSIVDADAKDVVFLKASYLVFLKFKRTNRPVFVRLTVIFIAKRTKHRVFCAFEPDW